MGQILPYLCSTADDLKEEEAAVLTALEGDVCLNTLKKSYSDDELQFINPTTVRANLILVVVGYEYGPLIPGWDLSFTENEYRMVFSQRLPCLIYFKVPHLNDPFSDTRCGRLASNSLKRFKKLLLSRHTVTYFTDTNDLTAKVLSDIHYIAKDLENAKKLRKEVGDIPMTPRYYCAPWFWSEAIFLSYSRVDEVIIDGLIKELKKTRMHFWVDKHMMVGGRLDYHIISALSTLEFYALFLSKDSIASEWVTNERSLMTDRLMSRENVILAPILIEDVEVPPSMRNMPCIDLRSLTMKKAVNLLNRLIKERRNQITFVFREY